MHIQAQVPIITTIGGNGIGIYGDDVHDGGPATNAEIRHPEGLCLDNTGNIYIAESGNNRVRKINAVTHIVTTIGGTGAHGFFGDNGPATDAQFLAPEAVFSDKSGNIFVADAGNNRVRRITQSGVITTVVGSGSAGIGLGSYSGDGMAATNSTLKGPTGLYLDSAGTMYIADYDNNRIRKVDHATGIITTIAGNGTTVYPGDGLPATSVGIAGAIQVFADSHENIFFCDQLNHSVRKITTATGIITTVAGIGTPGHTGDNGPATNAQLNQPSGIYIDAQNNIFLAEYGCGVIRRIDGTTGIITTVVGTSVFGYSGDGGPATDAKLTCGDVFLDKYGSIYIADLDNNRIRLVTDTTQRVGIVHLSSAMNGELFVYPNPAKDKLTIEGAENCSVSMYNLFGQEVVKVANTSKRENLDVHSLIPGVYVVQVIGSDGAMQNVRVVKE